MPFAPMTARMPSICFSQKLKSCGSASIGPSGKPPTSCGPRIVDLPWFRAFWHRRTAAQARPSGLLRRSFVFAEHLPGDAECIDAGRHARIDGHLHEDLANLFQRDAIAPGAADVQCEFVRTIENADHRQIEQAARLAGQFLATPD